MHHIIEKEMECTNVTDLIMANTSTGMIMTAARKVSFNWPMWMLLGFAALMELNLLTTEMFTAVRIV